MRNVMKVKYKMAGEAYEVIVFPGVPASHVVCNIAQKGASDIEVIGDGYAQKVEQDSIAIIEQFRRFIVSE